MNGANALTCMVWMQETAGLEPHRAQLLLQAYGSPEQVWQQDTETLARCARLSDGERRRLNNRELAPARAILERCREKSVQVIPIWDEAYPQRLREIYDPPLVLYARGKLPDWNTIPAIAVVGQRKATAYGMIQAERLGFQLSRNGVCVISGMAVGIDAAAHRGALQGTMPTVAVFGTAIDQCYPRENRELLQQILYHGAVVSEYPPGKSGHPAFFPRRNRIISGISMGVVVAEAPMKSGSLITAGLALEQGRDVFAVPGGVDIPSSEGCNDLIAKGAKLVRDAGDILAEYDIQYQFRECPAIHPELQQAAPAQPPVQQPQTSPEPARRQKKSQPQNRPEPQGATAALPPTDDPLLLALEHPMQADELSRRMGVPVQELSSRLTVLELMGRIRQRPGQIYERIS